MFAADYTSGMSIDITPPATARTEYDLRPFLLRLVEGDRLLERETYEIFTAIMTGRVHDAQLAALLALLQFRGAVVSELTGAARVMREHVTAVRLPHGVDRDRVIDTCGTGGAPKTFNISTLTALVAAACGAIVPKHGNRSRTGRGSAEVLEQLGVSIHASPEVQTRCLEEAGVCFCYAVNHHPATRHVMPVRRALGIPSIYNLLGPLTNPAGARRQLIGVYAPRLTEVLAEALALLGTERALVVHGTDGLDEFTTTAPTRVSELRGGSVTTRLVNATDLGLRRADLNDLKADTLDEAVALARRVLAGEPGPARDIVVLNASAACYVAGLSDTLAGGVRMASEAIDSGAAAATLARLAEVSHSGAAPDDNV